MTTASGTSGTTLTKGAVSQAASADLYAQVESLLGLTLGRIPEPAATGCRRIVKAGGKRLRPELVLRCAQAFAGQSRRGTDLQEPASQTVAAAVAVELLHSATLMHDDLLDDSETRRGVPSVYRHEGQSAAVIAGDALIAQSWRMIARCQPGDVEDLADALADMCAGEALQEQLRFRADARELDVLRVAQLKTGALLKAACRIGARRAGCSETRIEALGSFGSDFGVALQLVDDALDVVSDPVTLGKPCGADFAAGTVTIPTVFALAESGAWAAQAAELRELLKPDLDKIGRRRAQELLIGSGSTARTIELARSFARRAGRAVPAVNRAAAAELALMPGQFVEYQLHARTVDPHRWMLTDSVPLPDRTGDAFLGAS